MFVQKLSNLKRFVLAAIAVLLVTATAFAQNVTVKGTVTDTNGEPVIGAGVLIKGTNNGVSTDVDGQYAITVPRDATLRFTGLNYKEQEIPVRGRAVINVILQETQLTLDQAVVTAEFGMKRVARSVGSAVQNVKASEIAEAGRESFVTALQGRVSGMTVTSSSGAPGASTQVVLRSITSISGSNQPLYVVDGVPMNNSTFNPVDNTPVVGGSDLLSPYQMDYASRGNDINPEDIESMTILKGAAAAALYGSDASNGAIVITTKKGAQGKGKVTYNGGVTFNYAYGFPEIQTKYANGQYGTTNYYYQSRFGGLYPSGVTLYKNQEAILQTGLTHNHNVSVEGGTEKIMVRGSIGYYDSKGVIKTTDYKRLNIGLSGKAEITKWLNFEGSMSYATSSNHKARRYTSGPIYRTARWPLTDDVSKYMNDDGTMRTPDLYTDTDLLNPLFDLYKNKNYDESDRMQVSASLNITPTRHTYARVTTGWDIGLQNYQYFVHPYYADINGSSWGKGTYSVTDNNFKDQTLNAIAGYNNEWGKFSFGVQVGYHQQSNATMVSSVYGSNFLVMDFFGLDNCDPATVQNTMRHKTRRIKAISGQIELGWNNMAYLTVRGRNDWSSTLPKNNNHYFYPAIEASFIATELPFMKNLDAISYLKFRGAYAKVGKDATPLSIYPALESTGLWGGGFNYGYSGPNESLRPEMTTDYEVGFEGRFFNDRVNADFTWFKTICENQYVTSFRLSYATGFVLNNMNVGTFETNGWEAHVDGDIIRSASGFRWNLGVNLSHSTSVTTYLPESVSEYYNAYTWVVGNSRNGIKVGYPITSMTALRYQRNKAGDILIDPSSGLPLISENWEYLGDRQPKLEIGATSSMSYKGFRLSAVFAGRMGASVMNGTKYEQMTNGSSWESVHFRERDPFIFKGVLKNGNEDTNPTPNNIMVDPSVFASYYVGSTEDWFETGVNYLRLQEVRLSYNVPSKWIQNTTHRLVSAMNIWVKGTDLFVWTNYSGMDAVGNNSSAALGGYGGAGIDYWGLPMPRGLAFGLGLTF